MVVNSIQTGLKKVAGIAVVTGMLVFGYRLARSQSIPDSTVAENIRVAKLDVATDSLETIVMKALGNDQAIQDAAIERLRNLGQDAVDYLMSRLDLRSAPRWNIVLDKVAQQKDAQYCGLYWHTDLDAALAVAKRDKKPILSLRLLGNLTEELSCANSRFFRTTLYPNSKVKELLKNKFVLHWQWVRQAPVITIDFQDGRKLVRTITGNSLHMILDQQGRPVDVLPGLYSAEMFVRELKQAGPAAVEMGITGDNQFLLERAKYHTDRLAALQQSWNSYCQAANLTNSQTIGINHSDEVWNKIVPLASSGPVLDVDAQRAVAEKAPPAEKAGRLAFGKGAIESPMLRMVRNIGRLIQDDSVRNEYNLHVQIHNWLVTAANRTTEVVASDLVKSNGGQMPGGGFGGGQFGGSPRTVLASERHLSRELLVGRIYSDLFLSPLDDPWYGLSQPDVYSALKYDGRSNAVAQNAGH